MGIDIAKLELVKQCGNQIIARCPACAEEGHDRKGDHLCVYEGGRFSCVLFGGKAGHQHRQRIFQLVGVKDMPSKLIKIRKPAGLRGTR